LNESRTYVVRARYRRTVSSIPALKKLIPVDSETDEPIPFGVDLGELCPDVVFYELVDTKGNRFWSKKWLRERVRLEPGTRLVEAFLERLDRDDLCLARDYSERFGLIYDFNQRLFSSSGVVHYWNRRQYFTPDECRRIELTGSLVVQAEGLPQLSLSELTDFQIVRFGSGLVYLDFELFPAICGQGFSRDGGPLLPEKFPDR
jgi:hypothetical protein